MNHPIEIMSPAGSFETMSAAIQAGANAVYFGIEQLNMRARSANNFTIDDLPTIVAKCQSAGVKTYLTVNTILYNHDLALLHKICDAAKKNGVTAVIASDIAAISYANSIGLEVHISTQQNVSNVEAVAFYAKFADVIVLARELTLTQIEQISEAIKERNIRGPKGELVQIELFAHGALCVAISGKCYMSLATDNASANRGACLQNCRRSYRVTDNETGEELVVDNQYIMSPKDLCTIGFIDKILATGVRVLKLEGRGRSVEYVYTVTKAYREAVDSYKDGTYTPEKIAAWTTKLESVFNRGLWHGGYYLGKKLGEWSGMYGSQATKEKVFIGSAEKYFADPKVGQFIIESGELSIGDSIIIAGPTTGIIETVVKTMRVNDVEVTKAVKGNTVTLPIDSVVRGSDKLFVLNDRVHA